MKKPFLFQLQKDLIRGIQIGLGFCLAVGAVWSAISFASATWGNIPTVSSGSTLSSTAWNDLVSQINTLAKYQAASPIQYQAMLPGSGVVKYAANAAIPFTRVYTNTGGSYDATTATFTAPITGMYEFCISLQAWNDVGTANGVNLSTAGNPSAWVVGITSFHWSGYWEDNYKCRTSTVTAGTQLKYYAIGGGLNINASDITYVSGRLLYPNP